MLDFCFIGIRIFVYIFDNIEYISIYLFFFLYVYIYFLDMVVCVKIIEYVEILLFIVLNIMFFGYLDVNYNNDIILIWNVIVLVFIEEILIDIDMDIVILFSGLCENYLKVIF